MNNYEIFPFCSQYARFKEMVARINEIKPYPSRLYCSGTYPCLPKKGNSGYYYNQPKNNSNSKIKVDKKALENRIQRQEIKMQKRQEKQQRTEKENQIQEAFKKSSKKNK